MQKLQRLKNDLRVFASRSRCKNSVGTINDLKRLKSFCVAKPMQKLRWTERGWGRGFSFSLWIFQSGLTPWRQPRWASRGLCPASSSPLRRWRGLARGGLPAFRAREARDWMRRAICVRGMPEACEDDRGICLGRWGWLVMVLGPASAKAGGQRGDDPRRSKGRRADRPAVRGRRTDRRRPR